MKKIVGNDKQKVREELSLENLSPGLKASIKTALAQIKKGQVVGHNEVIKRLKKNYVK